MAYTVLTEAEREELFAKIPEDDCDISVDDDDDGLVLILDDVVSSSDDDDTLIAVLNEIAGSVTEVHTVYADPTMGLARTFGIDFYGPESLEGEAQCSLTVTWDKEEAAFIVDLFSIRVSTQEVAPSLPGVLDRHEGPLALCKGEVLDFDGSYPPVKTVEQLQEFIRDIASLRIDTF